VLRLKLNGSRACTSGGRSLGRRWLSQSTLLRQILRFGRPEDYVLAEEIWGRDALRQALAGARRGEIDPKSAHFWRLHFGIAAQPADAP
jgi:hypothetical protein